MSKRAAIVAGLCVAVAWCFVAAAMQFNTPLARPSATDVSVDHGDRGGTESTRATAVIADALLGGLPPHRDDREIGELGDFPTLELRAGTAVGDSGKTPGVARPPGEGQEGVEEAAMDLERTGVSGGRYRWDTGSNEAGGEQGPAAAVKPWSVVLPNAGRTEGMHAGIDVDFPWENGRVGHSARVGMKARTSFGVHSGRTRPLS